MVRDLSHTDLHTLAVAALDCLRERKKKNSNTTQKMCLAAALAVCTVVPGLTQNRSADSPLRGCLKNDWSMTTVVCRAVTGSSELSATCSESIVSPLWREQLFLLERVQRRARHA